MDHFNAEIHGELGSFTSETWCVVEHHIHTRLEPYVLWWRGAVRLSMAFTFHEASKNSHWRKYTNAQTYIKVTVVAVGTKAECVLHANRLTGVTMPECLRHGGVLSSKRRVVGCSNGQTYQTQSEAARATGCSQGNISAVLTGKLRQTRGLTFWYTEAFPIRPATPQVETPAPVYSVPPMAPVLVPHSPSPYEGMEGYDGLGIDD